MGSEGRRGGSGPQSERTQKLAAAVRAAAAQAADEVGGGIALVFATAPGDTSPNGATRLRAAAGFASAQAARDAAACIQPHLREVQQSGTAGGYAADPSLGKRAAAGLVIHPITWEGQLYGALVIGSPEPLAASREQALAAMAETLALRFDHARVSDSPSGEQAPDADAEEEEKSEEILKLSEALFAQDIELLRNTEKLGKVEKLKNDFIERMSRELRTPLNSIIEAIISVLTGENEALSESAKESLRSALDESTGFLRTLQNILDIWRLKQGELPVEIQEVNFRETVDEAIFSVQDTIGQKALAVEQDIPDDFPKIRTDLTKINQILFMLLDNAVKFTAGGKVTIAARIENDELRCDVTDTGMGICPDDRPYVFDEFFQVDTASSRRHRGAGLGLTLVRDLVVLLEGELSLQSEVGQGSRFSFTLPVQVVG